MSSSARGRSGVLPINLAITKKPTPAQGGTKSSPKVPSPRLRLIVRRLPPGLSEEEFWAHLGDEWKAGAGKVDWAAFKAGKISQDPSKPSRPARAYLRLREQTFLDLLAGKVRETVFQDAKNTTKDSCLLGPPSIEFAPFNKVPGGRIRHDGRQGTIDQDQEFIDFLQSLTEPIIKSTVTSGTDGETKASAVTTTPLIQFIREKKAAKAKEAAAAKNAKRQEAKDAKAVKTDPKAPVVVKGTKSNSTEKERLAKATQETVKAANKSVAALQSKASGQKSDPRSIAGKDATPPQPSAKRERERGNASVAARILQRDLGLAPKESRAARAQRTLQTQDSAEKIAPVNPQPATTPANVTQPQAPTPPPTGPRNARAATTASSKPAVAPTSRSPKLLPQPSTGGKSAFLKHANPSQGITEDLLRTAFGAFGTLTKCEIDKKKGFGYVDFVETEGLKKAMQASPVKVGNGQVVVLENKSRPPPKTIHTPTAAHSSAPKSPPQPPDTATSVSTSSTTTVPAVTVLPSESTSSDAVPPVAPKASVRGAPQSARGPRGSQFRPTRGNSTPGGRGAPRGGFRGGTRGGLPHQQRGGGRGGSSASSPVVTSAIPASSAPPLPTVPAAPAGE